MSVGNFSTLLISGGESFTFNSCNFIHLGTPVGNTVNFMLDQENVIDEGPTGEDNNQASYEIPLAKHRTVKSYSLLEKLLELCPNAFPILRLLLNL